ncbi:MAG: helix-turn-helix domain-containing protein [Deltaproteobacteria bacterium]|nr:helix-turn-helix domain-containing protein [Deltaproteobacteria bacterium]
MSKLFRDLKESIEGMDDFLRGKKVKGLTVKTVEIEPVVIYSAKSIKRLRARLKLSQAVLAGILGVTDKAVQAWEAGTNQPTGPAARMIDLLEKKPAEVVSLYIKRA